MSNNFLSSLIQQSEVPYHELGYLLPRTWWQQFCKLNQQIEYQRHLKYPNLNLRDYVDTFLLDYEDGLIAELEYKSNYLNINKIMLCPQPSAQGQWKIVSREFWNKVTERCKMSFCILTFQDDPLLPDFLIKKQEDDVRLQIVFCSKASSQVFMGFLPKKIPILIALQKIAEVMGFASNETRISYPQKNPQKSYRLHELQSVYLEDVQDPFLLVFNMDKIGNNAQQPSEQVQSEQKSFSFGMKNDLNNSNEANAGDTAVLGITSFQQIRNDGTMSTGAQTPSFWGSEDGRERGEFRVRQLFRQKKPEQIQQLKVKAKKIINHNNLLSLPNHSESEMEVELENIVHELMDHISMHKKKTHNIWKQKQLNQ